MVINVDKFIIDESRSNPMVVAMRCPDCPANKICFFAAVGFGTVMERCENLITTEDDAICTYNSKPDIGG